MTRDHGSIKWQLQDLRQALKKEIDILESVLPMLTSEIYPASASFFTSTGSNPQRTRICDQQEVVPASGTNMESKASNFVPAHAPGGSSPGSSDAILQVFHSTTQPRSGVLLKTAVAKVISGISMVDANILFDEGAQRSFVTRDLANKLQLQTSGTEEVQLAAFGSSSKKVSHIDTATIYLLTECREKIAIDVLIVPTIAVPLRNLQRNVTSLPYLHGLKLAHPLTGEDIFSISLLIGADKYWDIVGNRVFRGDGPTAVQSKIGYLLSGPLPTSTTDTATDCIMNIITPPRDTYDLERFWKLESSVYSLRKMANLLNTLRHTRETVLYSKMGVIQHSNHGYRTEFQICHHYQRSEFQMHPIVELLTGNDGLTRAVTLRMSSGLITSRPIVKLYPLEVLLTFSSWPGGCRDDDDDHTWREKRRCTQGANVDVTL